MARCVLLTPRAIFAGDGPDIADKRGYSVRPKN